MGEGRQKKLLIDIQSLETGSRFRGIGRYVRGLVKSILNCTNLDIHFLINSTNFYNVVEILEEFRAIPLEKFHIFYPFKFVSVSDKNFYRNRQINERLYVAKVNKIDPDYFLICSFFEVAQPSFSSVKGLNKKIKKGVIIYDFIPYESPMKYLRNDLVREQYIDRFNELTHFDVLFCISDYVRKLANVYIPSVPSINVSSSSDIALFSKKETNGKNKKERIFYFGGSDERKNLPFLIRSFKYFKNKVDSDYSLTIAVGNNKHAFNELQNIVRQESLENAVQLLLRPTDDELIDLVTGSMITIFPSLEEGFGLPVLEAMQLGTPVICSNTTSLPEVVGLKEATFDPTDVKDCARVMEHFLCNKKNYEKLKNHIETQKEKFNWNNTANKVLNFFSNLKQEEKKIIKKEILKTLIKDLRRYLPLSEPEVNELAVIIKSNLFDNFSFFRNKNGIQYLSSTSRMERKNILFVDNVLNPQADLVDNFKLYNFFKTDVKKEGNNDFNSLYLMNKRHKLFSKKDKSLVPFDEELFFTSELLAKLPSIALICDSFQQIGKLPFWKALKKSSIKLIYTQHGVNYFKPGFLGCDEISENRYDYIVVSSELEKNLIKRYYNYSDKQFIEAGLARWDEPPISEYKSILFYFTGREYLNFINKNKQVNLIYYQNILALLRNPQLKALVTERNLKVYLAFHHTINLPNLQLPPYINLIDDQELTKIKKSCSVLVTDFSSMCFDFIVQKKPVRFYVPDLNSRENLASKDSEENMRFLETKIINLGAQIESIESLVESLSYENLTNNCGVKKSLYPFYSDGPFQPKLASQILRILKVEKKPNLPILPIGNWSFGDDPPLTFTGLSIRTKEGRLSDGENTTFNFFSNYQLKKIVFKVSVVLWGYYKKQPSINVYLDGDYLFTKYFSNPNAQDLEIPLQKNYFQQKVTIRVQINESICPKELGLNQDMRSLCLLFHEVTTE